MTRALVLLKAMPPTKGHLRLIDFASQLADEVTVLMDTQKAEPMVIERVQALYYSIPDNAVLEHIYFEPIPTDDNYWPEWDERLKRYEGFDYVVASEDYAFEVARKIGARYIPYDPNRELFAARGTSVRDNVEDNFAFIAPEFQDFLKTTVTIFGAESTGKTTLSKALAKELNAHWTFEWARPYLETVGPEINVQSMTEIWKGQAALERQADGWKDKPFVVRDTDLWSTVGYWLQPHWTKDLGAPPVGLVNDAYRQKADLYIILKSNIPFEQDPIRYGGDRRESPDEYWINVAEKHGLNYVVIDETDLDLRLCVAKTHARLAAARKARGINFDRTGLG